MKYFSYLNSATDIITAYKGQQPFHLFIKEFFRQYKKYGSSDRKQITQLCYAYFRLGRSLPHFPTAEKIIIGFFLCNDQNSPFLVQVKPEWEDHIHLSFKEKCGLLHISLNDLHIFPLAEQLGKTISKDDFILSHFIQPDVFLRSRPGHYTNVIKKIEKAGIVYSSPAADCISIANTTKIDTVIDLNREAVVQDYSSQRTGDLLLLPGFKKPPVTWDCCAASGGKSIMAKDLIGNIDLTVSDIRETVIINLKKRFSEAGISRYKTLLTDVSKPIADMKPAAFELVIADVPCTGSGTWGRTPERLSFFEETELDEYSGLQKKIVTTAIAHLSAKGYLLYITCSVFEKENKEMVSFIQDKGLDLIQMETIEGYAIKADTMFAALLRKKE